VAQGRGWRGGQRCPRGREVGRRRAGDGVGWGQVSVEPGAALAVAIEPGEQPRLVGDRVGPEFQRQVQVEGVVGSDRDAVEIGECHDDFLSGFANFEQIEGHHSKDEDAGDDHGIEKCQCRYSRHPEGTSGVELQANNGGGDECDGEFKNQVKPPSLCALLAWLAL
jgi:hypothetical protein